MRTREAELQAAGANLVFVGSGLPAMAADFARQHAGPHPVLSDPQRSAFAAAGMRRGWYTLLHWRFVANLWRSLRAGFRQAGVQGDPWQHGGVLVLAADRRLLHQQLDTTAGDEVDVDAVLAAVRRA
ncbi:MAG: AhpC/TSA family protein [Planctomycetes bacterium]|nr:AhpC/TSA family protein [Planctomycetota bacterium]